MEGKTSMRIEIKGNRIVSGGEGGGGRVRSSRGDATLEEYQKSGVENGRFVGGARL
jgi:hypothetical protein